MTSIGIFGNLGRMGRAIEAAIPRTGGSFAGGIDHGGDASALARSADVLVDFSAPGALDRHLTAAQAAATPIVIGTTGLTGAHHRRIDEAARDIAVLQTGNTSLGIAMLAALVKDAASRLGIDWDVEVLEMHHRAKVDAPSGTALMLGDAAAEGRGSDLSDLSVVGRAGLTGERTDGTIGFASLRGGTVAGDHSVIFAGNGERITLSHQAESRDIFAHGAIRAALWLAGQQPGRYTMNAVLGL
ncbi:4-hydroxy-tetrahydrodipicolinate reductase [Stakelama saccharophila]|uniref:4-hydroxy-tetrahydrodipicolinate reductase n=1 Tax=Stakelama saccharophila TaxID=3075605 RepID=A0ABZ0B8K5_9SPHN|nr:4-hydroxy-tetrahydrodipicolinate reductase [Stakelama sp. W311]WNO53598.1 4-hydroxy-tetrahydrodipicolinate reductase [Stakelama sp. W311]